MMKRLVLALWVVSMIVGGTGMVFAQPDRPPTIFLFASNIPSVTMTDLESGDLTITLGWHVAHVDGSHSLRLYAYQGYDWTLLHDPNQGLPAVGNLTVPLEHPGNFNSPTYKIVILNARGNTMDERTLVIPLDRTDGQPTRIDTFVTETQSIEAVALASGKRVTVTWRVTNRPPLSNLVFEQVLDPNSEQAQNIELLRDRLWVPSSGTGAVVPVQPPNGSVITLRLRLLDVITAHIYAEQTLTISVTGAAIPATESAPVSPSAPPETSAETKFGGLIISDVCLSTSGSASERGWIDGDGIRSPDQGHIAYATNALGDAKLVIVNADGSGQVIIDVPDKAFPIGIHPVWSPDSERIAFANIAISQPGGGELYVVQRDGTDLREIVSYTGFHDDLAWSEDGTQVYFTSGVASGTGSGAQVGNYTVYAIAADGLGAAYVVAAGCAVRP